MLCTQVSWGFKTKPTYITMLLTPTIVAYSTCGKMVMHRMLHDLVLKIFGSQTV